MENVKATRDLERHIIPDQATIEVVRLPDYKSAWARVKERLNIEDFKSMMRFTEEQIKRWYGLKD